MSVAFRTSNGDFPDLSLLRPCAEHMTFERLIPCRVNGFALEVARAVASGAEEEHAAPDSLYVYSRVGVGKTHLLCAIAHAVGAGARMVNVVDLVALLDQAVHHHRRADLRAWLVDAEVLLLDDFQTCRHSVLLQEELFAVMNHRIAHQRPTIVASDMPPARMHGIQQRVMSRACAGIVVAWKMGDKEERVRMLRSFAGDEPLAEEVIDYLATEIDDSVRRLKSAVTQILAMQRHTGVPADITLARAVVPLPEDVGEVKGTGREESGGASNDPTQEQKQAAERFKRMMEAAETPAEQALALEIAVGERLRQLRRLGAGPDAQAELRQVMEAIRRGEWKQVLQWLQHP